MMPVVIDRFGSTPVEMPLDVMPSHVLLSLANTGDVAAQHEFVRRLKLRAETKDVRRVRDATYWGKPVGTPITPGMKPTGKPNFDDLATFADIPPEVLDILKRAQGVPGEKDHSDPNADLPFGKRVGNCYEFAAQYELEHPSSTLVHGMVQGMGNPPIYHAWVKRHDGMVFEPTSGHWMSQEDFDWYFNAKEEQHYTYTETLQWMRDTRHYGPWEGDNAGRAPLGDDYSPAERHQREVDAGRVDAAMEPPYYPYPLTRENRPPAGDMQWSHWAHIAENRDEGDLSDAFISAFLARDSAEENYRDHYGIPFADLTDAQYDEMLEWAEILIDMLDFTPTEEESPEVDAAREPFTVDESWRDVPFDTEDNNDLAYFMEERNPPAKLYHVAPRAMRERILANGLDASGQTWNTGAGGTDWYEDEWLWTTGEDGEPFRYEYRPTGVYMFGDIERARGYYDDGEHDIYEIDTETNGREIVRDPSVAENWDYTDDNDKSYVTRYVEPDALRLISPVDAARTRVPLSSEDGGKVGLNSNWTKPFAMGVDAARTPGKSTRTAIIRDAISNAERDGQPYIDVPGIGSISVEDAKQAMDDLKSGAVYEDWQSDNGTGFTTMIRNGAADLVGYTETSDEDTGLGYSGPYSRIIAQGLIDRADAAPLAHDMYRGIYLPHDEGQSQYVVGGEYRAPLAAFTGTRWTADFFATGQFYDIDRDGIVGVVVHAPVMRAFKLDDDDEDEWIGHGDFTITSVERQTINNGDVLYVEVEPKPIAGRPSIDYMKMRDLLPQWQAWYMPETSKPDQPSVFGMLLDLLDGSDSPPETATP